MYVYICVCSCVFTYLENISGMLDIQSSILNKSSFYIFAGYNIFSRRSYNKLE